MPRVAKLNEEHQQRLDTLEWIHRHMMLVLTHLVRPSEILSQLRKGPLDELPNILFYGSIGFPLEYMAYALVTGETAPPTKNECVWENKLPYYESERFFEIQCRHPDMPKDLNVLCDFMKHISTMRCIHQTKHVFLLRDIEWICQTEYHYVLRVLLERYSHNVIFLATTHTLSKIEPPLLSRFMWVRVPQPTPDDRQRLSEVFGNGVGTGTQSKTLMEILYELRAGVPEEKKELEAFLGRRASPSFAEVRYCAYRCFQQGLPFARFCGLLLQYSRTVKFKGRLLSELAALEHQLVQSSRGREPLYYEKALWMAIHANSLWK
jgi:hypothetical protein